MWALVAADWGCRELHRLPAWRSRCCAVLPPGLAGRAHLPTCHLHTHCHHPPTSLLQLVEWVYELLSKLRFPMSKGMDAVLAMRRMKMTSEGIEHCVDDEEECQAEW